MQDKIRMTQDERARWQKSRPTIGYLTASLAGFNQVVWSGIVDAARKQDVNLICFEGNILRNPTFWAQSNIIYELVTAENVDGLISWASMIGNYVTIDELEAFHERYRPLPVVTMGQTLARSPGVLMDSYEGMREAIVHLIKDHGYRRLAFIRGPEGHVYAQGRYRAYVETLEAYDLPLDLNLVTPPMHWSRSTGSEAMRLLLDERGLRPQIDFEAIVAVSEITLIGALDVLQAREINIPGDVAVVGFDDTILGQTSTPPLTSVAPPYYETGYQAVETLLTLMAGGQVPHETTVPSKLIIRQSCGCPSSAVVQAAVGSVKQPAKQATLEEVVTTQRTRLLSDMVQAIGDQAEGPVSRWAEQLLDSFVAEMEDESPDLFLSTLEDILYEVMAGEGDPAAGSGQHVAAWQGVMSSLRRNVMPYLDDEARARAEDLWQQARVAIGEATQQAYARQALQAEQQTQVLREIEAALITTFDVDELMDVLARELPRLGIRSCYLALYENPTPYQYPQPAPEWSRLILAYDEADAKRPSDPAGPKRVELEPDGRRFPSRQLAPEEMLPQDRWYSFVVDPLYLRENQLGFVLFEAGPREANVYAALRQGISSALYGTLLLQERQRAEAALEKAYADVEKQVEERTAELRREITERERAQEENLRLQQEVIEAQKRAIQELSTPIIPLLEGIIVVPLIGSIDSMRARDITRNLLAGISEHRAKVVILDITGVPVVDSGVANYLNKAIQAARLKGARTIVTGVSEAVAETIVDLGIDWSGIETLADLQTGLRAALQKRTA